LLIAAAVPLLRPDATTLYLLYLGLSEWFVTFTCSKQPEDYSLQFLPSSKPCTEQRCSGIERGSKTMLNDEIWLVNMMVGIMPMLPMCCCHTVQEQKILTPFNSITSIQTVFCALSRFARHICNWLYSMSCRESTDVQYVDVCMFQRTLSSHHIIVLSSVPWRLSIMAKHHCSFHLYKGLLSYMTARSNPPRCRMQVPQLATCSSSSSLLWNSMGLSIWQLAWQPLLPLTPAIFTATGKGVDRKAKHARQQQK